MIIESQQGSQSRTVVASFFIALIVGALCAATLLTSLHIAQYLGVLPEAEVAGAGQGPLAIVTFWVAANLKGSLYPFIGVFLLFLLLIERLVELLKSNASIEQISQTEYMADLCTSLFFGIGVIWTAIGMRSALLAGLGGLDSAVAAEVGAFAILQRLVDGGILLALSTTIVGGVGGYLMRVYKSLRTGAKLRHRFVHEARASEKAVLDRLDELNANFLKLMNGSQSSGTVVPSKRLP